MRKVKHLKQAKINHSLGTKTQARVGVNALPIMTGLSAGQNCPPNCKIEIPVKLVPDKK